MSDDESVTEEPAAAAALGRGSRGDWSGGVGVRAAADSFGGPYVFVRGCASLCLCVRVCTHSWWRGDAFAKLSLESCSPSSSGRRCSRGRVLSQGVTRRERSGAEEEGTHLCVVWKSQTFAAQQHPAALWFLQSLPLKGLACMMYNKYIQ